HHRAAERNRGHGAQIADPRGDRAGCGSEQGHDFQRLLSWRESVVTIERNLRCGPSHGGVPSVTGPVDQVRHRALPRPTTSPIAPPDEGNGSMTVRMKASRFSTLAVHTVPVR